MSKARIAALVASGLTVCSAGAYQLIKKWESSGKTQAEHVVYADKLANGLPTVCDGLTRYVTTTPIIVGDVWPQARCDEEVKRAIVNVQADLFYCFQRTPPQNVFDAATSHAWNHGALKTCGSESMRLWNDGKWDLGCKLMQETYAGKPNWSYANGKFVQGLQNRRVDERHYCEAWQ